MRRSSLHLGADRPIAALLYPRYASGLLSPPPPPGGHGGGRSPLRAVPDLCSQRRNKRRRPDGELKPTIHEISLTDSSGFDSRSDTANLRR